MEGTCGTRGHVVEQRQWHKMLCTFSAQHWRSSAGLARLVPVSELASARRSRNQEKDGSRARRVTNKSNGSNDTNHHQFRRSTIK